MQDTIDPTVKALVSALGEAETGTSSPEAYTKRGASGEYGRYQFMPDTWSKYASKAGVATPLESSSVEEQNRVAYQKIREWKEQGYNPAQIASMWNAGEGRPNAYKENWKGVNSKGVEYDTPAYAEKVSAAYQRLKGETYGVGINGQDQPLPAGFGEGSGDGTFFGDLGDSVAGAATKLAGAIGRGASGEINPLSGVIQSAGAIAGGVGDVTSDVLHHIPLVGTAVKGIEDVIGKGVGAAAETELGQSTLQAMQQFAAEHPELADDIEAGFDIATAVPILKGVGVAKNLAKGSIDTVLRGSKDAIYDAIKPNLGPVATADAIMRRGIETKGLLRVKELAPDPDVVKQAALIKKNVPGFTPDDLGKSIAETQNAVNELKTSLKQDIITGGADRIYPTKELMSRLNAIEKPMLIARDATLNRVYGDLIKVVGQMAEKQGGKVSGLSDVLSDFDGLVKKQFPNLYKSDQLTPLRSGVKDIREAIKDFAVEKLPEGTGLKERMLDIHHLLNAMQSMSKKAGVGAGKELGTDVFSRAANRHPIIKGLVKTGAQAAAQGAGVGGVIKIFD